MTNRTICCLAVSFTAGLLYGRYQTVWLCIFLIAFLLWRLFKIVRQQEGKTVPVAVLHTVLCVMLFVLGNYHFSRQQNEFRQAEQYAGEQEIIQVQGKVYWSEKKQGQFIYYLKDTGILAGNQWYPCGRIQVYSSKDSYQIGNFIQAEGRYEAFQLPRNEGNFNEEQYYYSKKINMRVISYQEELLDGSVDAYRVWLQKLRHKMEQVFQNYMPERLWGIMANMVLGSKELADREVKALYQKAGISHILAVSGLHISIFGMGLYRFLRRIYCPLPVSAVLAAGVIYSFGILTGMELSTGRAVLMFLLMMVAGIFGYTYDSVNALSLSAIIQLWENPFALWYAGFQLSYAAVLGAVVIAGIAKGTKKNILDTLLVSFCIQLSTLPISIFFYYEVSGYSIPVNGCVLPFMGILLFFGAVGGVTGLFCPQVAAVILKVPAWILTVCESVCRFFTELPGSSMITGKPSIEKMILYYTFLVLVLYLVHRTEKKRYFLVSGIMIVMLCCGNRQKGVEVDFLDVGQGDGIFLQSEQGNGIFIDGGSNDVGKVGTYRILPFLKCRGIKEIQLWFVSHADADHISGLKEILESGYPVKNIVFADGIVKDEVWKELAELAERSGSNIYYIKAGESITLEDLKFTALYPWEEGTGRNEASLVLLAEMDGMTGIFSGDIGKEQEAELISDKEFLEKQKKPLTFYKAAHHGSDNSNSTEFLEILSPQLTVVSCGANNSYGHPGEKAVERIEEAGSQIFYTMESGQIKIWQKEGRVFLQKFQN